MQKPGVRQYELHVTGRVQGVGFRNATRNRARELGLRGWVRNLPDGSVRIVIQGRTEACNQFIAWCRSSPGYSWVDKIDYSETGPEELGGFSIRY